MNMNYKKGILIVAIFSAVIFIGVIFISFYLSLIIAHQNALEFCFSPGCFEFAAKALQEPIKIFKVGVEFGAYSFAAIGAATAILTYTNSVRTEKNNRHIQKHSEFKRYALELISAQNSGLKPQDFNANRYYNLLFPNSADACFTPSALYSNTIFAMGELVTQSHVNFIPNDMKSFEGHYKEMMNFFQMLGVAFEEPSAERLILLEPKIFIFIDSINKQFTEIDVQLHSRPRDYSRLA